MDGIGRVHARIAAIEQRVAALAGTPAAPVDRPGGTQPAGTGPTTSFAQVYGAALERTSFAARPRSPEEADGPIAVPPELARYGNGRIPAAALTPIGIGNHRLWGPAAESFRQLLQDAAADGVRIGVTDSYRSYDEQVDLAARKGLYSQGGLAARPGTSNHGWGLALDLDLDDRAQAWMRQHGWMYGFVETVPREPWHWEFRPD